MNTVDYQGVALIIGSVAGAITLVGGFAMQVAGFVRQGRIATDQKILLESAAVTAVITHDLVNGKSEELKKAIEKAAFSAGVKSGTEAERATPMVPRQEGAKGEGI